VERASLFSAFFYTHHFRRGVLMIFSNRLRSVLPMLEVSQSSFFFSRNPSLIYFYVPRIVG